jgi:glycosyltransferase involved in cell wall biosynthesis
MSLIIKTRRDITLLIAGDGPQLGELIEYSRKTGLQKNVQFFKEVNTNLLEKLYVTSDIIILPSLIEAFGLVVLESMAYSKTIISFDSGGPTELISQNNNGLIVENRNIKQLSETILYLLNSPSLIKKFRDNCEKNVKKYDWVNITNELISLYNKVIQ